MEHLGNSQPFHSLKGILDSLDNGKENQNGNAIHSLAQERLSHLPDLREIKKSTETLSLSHSQEILCSSAPELIEEQEVELADLMPYTDQIQAILNTENKRSLLVAKLQIPLETALLESLLRYLEIGGCLVFAAKENSRNLLIQELFAIHPPISEEIFSRIGFLSKKGEDLFLFTLKSEEIKLESSLSEKGVEDVFYIDASKEEEIFFQREMASPTILNTLGIEQKYSLLQQFFQAIVDKGNIHPHLSLFENFSYYPALAENRLVSQRLVEEALHLYGGREEINRYLLEMDRSNGPVRYEVDQINAYIEAFQELKNSQEMRGMSLNYSHLLDLNEKFKAVLKDRLREDVCSLANNFGVPETSFESLMREALDKMEIKEEGIVRILEPGNNDQSTPLFVARQIESIFEYAKEKNLNITIQVLLMGLGGHATTAVFPQIGELKEGKFYGTPEAVSLGGTLKEALIEREINVRFVERFEKGLLGEVQIKLAKDSRNTGENVTEAVKCDENEAERPSHLFVASARPASLRQTLTFAQQYSENKQDPLAKKLYQSITSIPFSRSAHFLEHGLTHFQAVTEMYMGLAEECRLFLYGFSPETDYIPASPIKLAQLDRLYTAYDKLSNTNDLEESKNKTIKELLTFFAERANAMEKAIDWSPELERQQIATKNVAARIVRRIKRRESFLRMHTRFCEWKKNPEAWKAEEKRLFNMYAELLNKAQSAKSDKEKIRYYLVMGLLSKRG